jgi:hypothetical protein
LIIMTTNGGKRLLPDGERREICPHCAPEEFQEPFLAPVDRRLWAEHEAKPYLYHRRPDGFFELNDSPKADLASEWEKDPDVEAREKAIARKRAQRRTKPLESWEIEQANRVWTPIVKQHIDDVRRQEEGDALYTENLIDNLIRKDRDGQAAQISQ